MNSIVNIGVVLWPSIRSIAYLSAFDELGLAPSEIYRLNGPQIGNFDEVIKESDRHNYSENFFDVSFNVEKFISDNNIPVTPIDTSDVNSEILRETLRKSKADYLLFTGGGILKKETLEIQKKFIHIHPGILPKFRGSTCFYYSILAEGSLGATAIFLEEQIDVGGVIASSKFDVNYDIVANQPLFADYILDSFVRASTLKKVLNMYREKESIESVEQPEYDKPAYYVMHPLLRHKAIHKMANTFSKDQPKGIFQI